MPKPTRPLTSAALTPRTSSRCWQHSAFGTEVNVDGIAIEGIEAITLDDIRNAGELGYKIKLLGVAVKHEGGVEQRVHPTLVRQGAPMADTDGVFNAVAIKGDFVGDLLLEGRGAGAHPTASAVLSDIVDIARGNMRGRCSACLRAS